mmetsp:Transcript_66422/g.110443  ORF Transcript_66422/g.110443 Transcript_66422/m.110443 type:complete len:344 (-) Transcript_66422:159-1190(-)
MWGRGLGSMLLVGLVLSSLAHAGTRGYPAFFDTGGRLLRGGAIVPLSKRLYVPVHNGNCLINESDTNICNAVFLSQCEAEPFIEQAGCITAYIGAPAAGGFAQVGSIEEGPVSFFLLDVSHLAEPPEVPCGPDCKWRALRSSASLSVLDRMEDDDEGALLSTARGLSLWHRSVRFCSVCGGKTESHREGANRRCTVCGTRFRPRLDASIIVLVTRGNECLLGRKASWPEGRYSTLSGFVEFGETLEECVAREVQEESGVVINRETIRYVASQPWLFPRSLMVGFLVESYDGQVRIRDEELQDVRWFDRTYVAQHFDATEPGGFHVPSRVSLAHTIIKQWLDES